MFVLTFPISADHPEDQDEDERNGFRATTSLVSSWQTESSSRMQERLVSVYLTHCVHGGVRYAKTENEGKRKKKKNDTKTTLMSSDDVGLSDLN